MHRIVEAKAEGRLVGLSDQAAETVERSLPDRKAFAATLSKNAFMASAVRLGIRIPAFCEVFTIADVLAYAEEHGYPLVLKSGIGNAGSGVRICADEDELVLRAGELLMGY